MFRYGQYGFKDGKYGYSKNNSNIGIHSRRLDSGGEGTLVSTKEGESIRQGEGAGTDILFKRKNGQGRTL